ncbi:MAG: ArsR/SmtB family transcription factor [Planctomycetota bacterium]|jgi:DNA-binding transcriptional ArsR family regulator
MSKRSPVPAPEPAACCPRLDELLSPRFFRALGDPNRVALVLTLARWCRPCTVTEMTCCLPVDFSVVSRHLSVLRDAGIVHAEKRGKQVFYSVDHEALAHTLRQMATAIEACRCPSKETKTKTGTKARTKKERTS